MSVACHMIRQLFIEITYSMWPGLDADSVLSRGGLIHNKLQGGSRCEWIKSRYN